MEIKWIEKIYNYDVEHREIIRPMNKPYYLNSSTLIGVLHNTEGSTADGAWSTLNSRRIAPHFIAGENRIVQCRPLNAQGSALRPGNNNSANVHAQIQIEMVAFSKKTLWLPDEPTLQPTVTIIAFCAKYLGIPLRIPNDWPDDISDMDLPWATRNRRRRQAEKGPWPMEKGWWMHLEVPYQGSTWHWDCGALQRSSMFTMASNVMPHI